MTTKRRYIIRETDKRCVINGKQRPGIPLLMRRDGLIVAPVSRWLRTVALERDRTLTALTYGDHLRMFWGFLDDSGTDWEHVDDAVLLRWRKQQERHGKKVRKKTARHALRKTTINTRLGTVVAFYRWAERNGYLRPGHVGEVLYREDGTRIQPRITLVESNRRGRGRGALVPNVLLKGADSKTPRHTPTRTEIDDILREARREAKTPELADRNVLMIRWASEAACRRMEYASLKVGQIMRFTDHEIQTLAATRKEAVIRVLAKRRAAGRDVAVSPDLLQATREFVETSRAAIIGRIKERNRAYRDPGFVFITGKGKPLSLKSITNVMGNAFRAAGVEDASGHRLRAHGITEVFEAMYLADRQTATLSPATLLARVAERFGHRNPNSLKHYLNDVIRRYSASDLEISELVEARREAARLRRPEEADHVVLDAYGSPRG